MNTVKIKCRDFMVGDWIANQNGSPMQIVAVDEDNAYACEGNEERPWIFGDDEGYKPEPILLTPEILKKNGWKYHKNLENLMEMKVDEDACFRWINGHGGFSNQNGCYMYDFKYVHTLQHLLRYYGLNELADNFKV